MHTESKILIAIKFWKTKIIGSFDFIILLKNNLIEK